MKSLHIPPFGIDINFIDNRDAAFAPRNRLTVLNGGFMTDSIPAMVEHLRETADKLERLV